MQNLSAIWLMATLRQEAWLLTRMGSGIGAGVEKSGMAASMGVAAEGVGGRTGFGGEARPPGICTVRAVHSIGNVMTPAKTPLGWVGQV